MANRDPSEDKRLTDSAGRRAVYRSTASGTLGGALSIVTIVLLDRLADVGMNTFEGAILVMALQTVFSYLVAFLPQPREKRR